MVKNWEDLYCDGVLLVSPITISRIPEITSSHATHTHSHRQSKGKMNKDKLNLRHTQRTAFFEVADTPAHRDASIFSFN
jgi:hypothetical protein